MTILDIVHFPSGINCKAISLEKLVRKWLDGIDIGHQESQNIEGSAGT